MAGRPGRPLQPASATSKEWPQEAGLHREAVPQALHHLHQQGGQSMGEQVARRGHGVGTKMDTPPVAGGGRHRAGLAARQDSQLVLPIFFSKQVLRMHVLHAAH